MAEQLIHFGRLSVLYDNGFIRYIRSGEVEIVRSIYFALRDSNWATPPIRISDERVLVTPKSFEISFIATNIVKDTEVFRWYVKISGIESGEVEFSVDGECLTGFNRNRAGICVLHPIRENKGKDIHITRPDGSKYHTRFPTLVSPHQPFFDIKEMSWQIFGDAWAKLQFEGDVFETEDQRNWGDASFKTYSTPQAIPFPVMLKPGDKVYQKVRLTIVNADSLPAPDITEDIEIIIDESAINPFPKIGTDYSSSDLDLEELKFDHLRIEVTANNKEEKLTAGLKEAERIGAKPFVHAILNSPGEFDLFSVQPHAVSPVDKKANMDDLLDPIVAKSRIGAGFTTYFTELNRYRFDYSKVDFVIYPLTPQAHLPDLHTAIENLPAQKDQVLSTRAFVNGKNIHVGPVTVNAPAKIAAGWMLASIKYLSEGGASRITMLKETDFTGEVFNAFKTLRKLDPARIIGSNCNEPLVISSLVIESESNKRHLILINHTDSKRSVTVGDKLYTLNDFEIQFILLK